MTDGKRRETPLSVAFGANERRRVRRAAFLSDVTLSAFIRQAAVNAADRVLMESPEWDEALPPAA